jgi:hypothetical protein
VIQRGERLRIGRIERAVAHDQGRLDAEADGVEAHLVDELQIGLIREGVEMLLRQIAGTREPSREIDAVPQRCRAIKSRALRERKCRGAKKDKEQGESAHRMGSPEGKVIVMGRNPVSFSLALSGHGCMGSVLLTQFI